MSLFRGKNFVAKLLRCFVLVAGSFRFLHLTAMNDSFLQGGLKQTQSAVDNEDWLSVHRSNYSRQPIWTTFFTKMFHWEILKSSHLNWFSCLSPCCSSFNIFSFSASFFFSFSFSILIRSANALQLIRKYIRPFKFLKIIIFLTFKKNYHRGLIAIYGMNRSWIFVRFLDSVSTYLYLRVWHRQRLGNGF